MGRQWLPARTQGRANFAGARIFTVVDEWDALKSARPCRPRRLKEKALTYIREQSGKHFDPQIVALFLQMLEV